MVDIERLRAAMDEKKITVGQASDVLGIDDATFYRRIRSHGEKFTVVEVSKLADLLDLEGEEIRSIFFSKRLA